MFGCMNNELKSKWEYQRRCLKDRKKLIRYIVEQENKLGSNGEIIYQPLDNEVKERWYKWIFSEYN